MVGYGRDPPQLLAQKAGFRMQGDEQIVARFMIEQLQFHGIRDAAGAATCLAGYDKTRYPGGSGPSFTGYFLPKAFGAGLRLEHSGADLWNAFEMLMRRKRLSLPTRARVDSQRLLELAYPVTLAAAAASSHAVTWLLWEASWRGMSTGLQVLPHGR
jgi:hypothetical protein